MICSGFLFFDYTQLLATGFSITAEQIAEVVDLPLNEVQEAMEK